MAWTMLLAVPLAAVAGHNRPHPAKAATLGAFSVQDSTADEVAYIPTDFTKQAAFTQTSAGAPQPVARDSDFFKGSEHLLQEAEEDDDKPDAPQQPKAAAFNQRDSDAEKYGSDVASIIADVDKDAIGTIDQTPVHKVNDDSELTSIGGSNDDPPADSTSPDNEAEAEAMDVEIKQKKDLVRQEEERQKAMAVKSTRGMLSPKVEVPRAVTQSLADRERLVNEQVAADTEAIHVDRKTLLGSVSRRQPTENDDASVPHEDTVEHNEAPAPLDEPAPPVRWSPKIAFDHAVSISNSMPAEPPKSQVLSSADHTDLMKQEVGVVPWLRWKTRGGDSVSAVGTAAADAAPASAAESNTVTSPPAKEESSASDSDFGFSTLLHDSGKQPVQVGAQKAEVTSAAQDQPKNFWARFAQRNADISEPSIATTTATTTTTTTAAILKSPEVDLDVDESTNPSAAAAHWLSGSAWANRQAPTEGQSHAGAESSLSDVHSMLKDMSVALKANDENEEQFTWPQESLWDAHKMLLDAKDHTE